MTYPRILVRRLFPDADDLAVAHADEDHAAAALGISLRPEKDDRVILGKHLVADLAAILREQIADCSPADDRQCVRRRLTPSVARLQ